MRSTPRFTRGTSVIAALVLAAILGAVALGLHVAESNSANSAALTAAAVKAAAAPTTPQTGDATCSDGVDYTYVAAPGTDFYPDEQGGQTLPSSNQTPVTGKPTPVQTCPSDAQAMQYQLAHPIPGQVTGVNGQTQGLPKTVKIPPGTAMPGAGNTPTTRNAPTCEDNQLKTQPIPATLCTYTLQTNNTYKLDNWMCRVSLTGPSGSGLCYVKDVPPNGSVNAPSAGNNNNIVAPSVPPAVCQSGSTYNAAACAQTSYCQNYPSQAGCNGTAPTVTPDTPPASVGAYCVTSPGNQSGTIGSDGRTCVASNTDTCTNGATAPACTTCPAGMVMGGGTCVAAGANGYCTNGATIAPACNTCPTGETFDSNSICNPSKTAPPTCPAGQTGTPPNCTASPPPPPAGPQQQPPGQQTQGGGSNPLSSLLSGLAKGLLSPCTAQQQSPYVGGNGTTYVQQNVLQPNGTYAVVMVPQQTLSSTPVGSASPCAPQQQAPYGVGSNGAACNQPPAQPQCAAGASPQPISASGNGCVTSYQCVPLNGSTISGTPTPQISCSPQIADVNEAVAISYSCQNATGSSGGGFSTNNQLSGSASSTISAPPAGSNTANFGLTCTNNGQVASAQCSVQINQPAIDLVADPQAVPSGQTSSIGWVTAGMQSCVISSPDDATFTSANASNTSKSGVAQSDAITGPTNFTLTCQTLGGQTKTATTQVTVGSSTSTAAAGENVSVNSSVDGQTSNHGGTVTINWQSTNAPSGSVLSLWLIDVGTEQATALISGAQSVNGSYQWQIPAVGTSCDPNSIAPCASTLVAGDSYGIEAALYTPANAFLGGSPAPANAISPSYSDYGYTPTPFTLGQ